MLRVRFSVGAAGALLAALAVFSGCDETHFTEIKKQVDTFVQEGEEVTDFFTQTGTMQVDTFEQTGFHQVDTFKQKAAGEVDILWVVDNSWSMGEEQVNLANNFASFMTYIDQSLIDYQIGVISTDMEDPAHSGRLQGSPKIITRATPNPQAAFAANVQVGTTGGGNEMGLLAAHDALSEPLASTDNAGFHRPEASMAIIFVSDEDDKSYGGIDFYIRFFSSLKEVGNENNVIITAIVAPDPIPGGCEAYYPGARYDDLVVELGGTSASICDTDFAATLQQLGLTVAGLTRKFVLSREPDPDTVVVRVDEGLGAGFVEIPEFNNQGEANWKLELIEKAIYFYAYVPPPQADIQVEYSNVEDRFHLSGRGDASTIEVEVDEVPMPQSDDCWQYHSGENAVIFYGDCIPELDSTVEVSYSDLEKVFYLSQEVKNPETLKVWLNQGSGFAEIYPDPASGWIYHPETNSVRFQGSLVPPMGAELKVTYSNLADLFPLSLTPLSGTISVTLDADGDGPNTAVPVPEYSQGTQGWVYYGPGEPAPFSNTISFEKLDPLPPFGSIIKVTYTPSG
jgi:hypothetical protein